MSKSGLQSDLSLLSQNGIFHGLRDDSGRMLRHSMVYGMLRQLSLHLDSTVKPNQNASGMGGTKERRVTSRMSQCQLIANGGGRASANSFCGGET
jgi:hypothetical protein